MTVTGSSNLIYLFFQMGKILNSVNDHTGSINDMQMSKDGTMFITASKDNTAKLFDTDSLMCLKTYKTERPVNSAAVSPIFDHVSQFSILI
jgi:translation initiation factor 3 subunit I